MADSNSLRKNFAIFLDAIEEVREVFVRNGFNSDNRTRKDEKICDYFDEIVNDMDENDLNACFMAYIARLWQLLDSDEEYDEEDE